MKISIQKLIERPLLHNDTALEVFNKMTPEERREWEESTSLKLEEEGVPHKFPDWNSAMLCREINLQILYDVLKNG